MTTPLSYIFMGSPPFAATVLEALCTHLHPPVAVVTQLAKASGRGQRITATAVEEYARSQDLNVFSTLDVNNSSTLDPLRTFEPDLILVAAFGQILRQSVLSLPKLSCLNVHASLLPRYRGASPIQRAIWNGDLVTGITIQKMARKLDTGDILLQRSLDVLPDETAGELTDRLAVLGGECLVDAARMLAQGHATFAPQDERHACYAPKIEREDALVDWSRSAAEIRRQVRALQPWPVAETVLEGDRLKIFRAEPREIDPNLPVGGIATDAKSFLVIRCGDGTGLSLVEVQLENRKRLPVRDFLSAYKGIFPYTMVG